MTYCLALALDDGIVFASDSRSNAGSDYVTTYGKTHVFDLGPDRLFVIMTAGNLSTTQEVINRLRRDVDAGDGRECLLSPDYLFEAAHMVGRVSLDVQEEHARGFKRTGSKGGSATMIFGGQIGDKPSCIFLIYPEGNAITVSAETPYLQIGESKYGKPILDRLIHPGLSLADGARLALVSLDATAKSNVTVGMPFDVSIYRHNSYELAPTQRFESDSVAYRSLNEHWSAGLAATFESLSEVVPNEGWELG